MSGSQLKIFPSVQAALNSSAHELLLNKKRDGSLVVVQTAGFQSDLSWKNLLQANEQTLSEARGVSRALARFFLSQILRTNSQDLLFSFSENGKPELSGARVSFNISHSDSYWTIAWSSACQVGVDLEAEKSWSRLQKVADRIFTDNELRSLQNIADDRNKAQEALRLWTLKEALIKLEGLTLFDGLARFEFQMNPSRCLQRPEVQFHHFEEPGKFVLTLALGAKLSKSASIADRKLMTTLEGTSENDTGSD